jgi:hypothetical protein
MSAPPTAPTIIPTNAPVERPDFECEANTPSAAAVEVGGMVVVATYVVPVGDP